MQTDGGYDYGYDELRGITLDECRTACANNYTCAAIDWNSVGEICRMQSSTAAPTERNVYNKNDTEVINSELKRFCPRKLVIFRMHIVYAFHLHQVLDLYEVFDCLLFYPNDLEWLLLGSLAMSHVVSVCLLPVLLVTVIDLIFKH